MKFCPECGCKLEDDVLFCGECGTRQVVEETPPVPVEEVIPEPVEEVIPEPVEKVISEPVAEEEAAPAGNVCPRCGFHNAEDDRFCMECGFDMAAPAERRRYCPRCQQENSEGDAFCMKCGQALSGAEPSAAPAAEKNEFEAKAREAAEKAGKAARKAAKGAAKLAGKAAAGAKKAAEKAGKSAKEAAGKAKGIKLPKGALIGAGVAVAIGLVLVILAVCGVFGGGKGGASYAMYLRDGEIFYTEFKKDDALQVTDRLADEMDNDDLAESAYIISAYTALVKGDGRMFYPDRNDDGAEGLTIYYRDLGKKRDGEKLDSEIFSYAVNEKGNQVIYLKGDDGKLYRSDLKDKEKIASDVEEFFVTEDLQKVMYLTTDGDLYIKTAKGDKEKIASDVEEIYHVAGNLQNVYYSKDGKLFRQKIGADKEKIADDVCSVSRVYESGEMYFVTAEEESVDLMKFVSDDLASSDAAITEPAPVEYPDYPSKPRSRNYDTEEEYQQALADYEQACADYEDTCAKLQADYEKAWEEYNAKQNRDYVRESLKEGQSSRSVYTLYYFDGKSAVKLAEDIEGPWLSDSAAEKPVVVVDVYGKTDGVKLDIADVEGSWTVTDALYNARSEGMTTCVVSGAAVATVGEDYRFVDMSADGKKIALMGDINEKKQEGTLYTAAVKGETIGEAELLAEDVYAGYALFNRDGKMLYFQDVSERTSEGDLYLEGKEVDYDVYIYSLQESETLGLLYTTDTKEGVGGTLKLLSGKKPQVVGEDIHSWRITEGGELYYLADYSDRKSVGEMHLYGKKKSLVDEDVVALLNPAHGAGEVCGGSFFW